MKYSALIIVFVLLLFAILENIFPLRVRKEGTAKRYITNILISLFDLPFTRLLTLPLVFFVASFVERSQLGLLNFLKLNSTLHFILGFLLLDYFIYWWHRANHEIRFFWRFHQVHHEDRDMDASTALRFHFGELILSALVRIILILIFGFKIKTILIFDLTVTSVAIFHHSNLLLPSWLEKRLIKVIVTPLFHQNHHSYFQKETDSNYSAIFSVWDRLHKSHTEEMGSEKITIGLPFFQEKISFLGLIKMPLNKLKAWPSQYIQRK